MYDNGQFLRASDYYIDYIDIFDLINLVEGNYIIVVSTADDQAVFGIEFSPVTTVLPILPDIGLPSYAYNTGPAYYYLDYSENSNCSYNEYYDYFYNNFTWTQPTSGYFDIYGIIINSTLINPQSYDYGDNLDIYLTLYSGYLTNNAANFQGNPCQPNFINGYDEGETFTALDYIWLNAGWNYTLVVSIKDEIYGLVAIQILPSNFVFLNNASFLPPNDDSTPDDCSTNGDDNGDLTGWAALTITAQYPVFVVADMYYL